MASERTGRYEQLCTFEASFPAGTGVTIGLVDRASKDYSFDVRACDWGCRIVLFPCV